MLLSQSDYARARGVTKQAIGKAVKGGKILLHDGKIDPREADQSWAGGLQPAEIASCGLPLPHQSRAVRQAYQAKLAKLEFEERSGKLVDVEEMERAWADAGQTFRDGLLSIPERLAPVLAALSDTRQVRDQLKQEIRNVLENLPDRIRNSGSKGERSADSTTAKGTQ
jgi:hypothetical protein